MFELAVRALSAEAVIGTVSCRLLMHLLHAAVTHKRSGRFRHESQGVQHRDCALAMRLDEVFKVHGTLPRIFPKRFEKSSVNIGKSFGETIYRWLCDQVAFVLKVMRMILKRNL